MDEGSDRSGAAARLGECEQCGATYPLRRAADGWEPVGIDGECDCGSEEFTPFPA